MPQPFRFVHAADLHLDTPYRGRTAELRKRLQDAGRKAFERLVDLCIDERVDALLLAGDVFDHDRITLATEAFLGDELVRLVEAGVHVVAISGNHDPGQELERSRPIGWPTDGFTLVTGHTPVEVEVPGRDGEPVGVVVATGHRTHRDTENLARRYDVPGGELPAVAVLHTQVESASGAGEHKPYAPCTTDDLAARAFDYWALGHVHKRQRVLDAPVAHYAGNLQGRHFGELGGKGALLVEVARRGAAPDVSFRPLAPVRWERIAPPRLHDAATLADLTDRVRTAFAEVRRGDDVLPDQQWMLRVELAGPCPLAAELRRDDERTELAERLAAELARDGVLDVELRDVGLSTPVDLDAHRHQPHLLGEVLALHEEALTDDDVLDHLAPEHLAHVHADASSDERRAYLRELLAGLDEAAAELLLRAEEPSR